VTKNQPQRSVHAMLRPGPSSGGKVRWPPSMYGAWGGTRCSISIDRLHTRTSTQNFLHYVQILWTPHHGRQTSSESADGQRRNIGGARPWGADCCVEQRPTHPGGDRGLPVSAPRHVTSRRRWRVVETRQSRRIHLHNTVVLSRVRRSATRHEHSWTRGRLHPRRRWVHQSRTGSR
jgi:hypothetical protein